MTKLTLNYIGFSGEKAQVGLPIPQLTALNIESYTDGGASTAFDALLAAVNGLTLLNQYGHTATAQIAQSEPVNATDPFAQRELGLMFFMSDTGGHKSRVVIPGPDLDIVAESGTDKVDLTITEVAALVTALETYCVDPVTGLAVTVTGARIIGRKN